MESGAGQMWRKGKVGRRAGEQRRTRARRAQRPERRGERGRARLPLRRGERTRESRPFHAQQGRRNRRRGAGAGRRAGADAFPTPHEKPRQGAGQAAGQAERPPSRRRTAFSVMSWRPSCCTSVHRRTRTGPCPCAWLRRGRCPHWRRAPSGLRRRRGSWLCLCWPSRR